MNPFYFPRARHKRLQKPGALRRHQDFKPYLQVEFARRCVYCRLPDTLVNNTDAFGVDHYRPQSLFPALAVSYRNLFYCCNTCNRNKSAYWPARGKGQTHFIPNPCDHAMHEHLRYSGPRVDPRTTAGEVARDSLDLNEPGCVRFRETWIAIADRYAGDRKRVSEGLAEVRRRMKRGEIDAVQGKAAVKVMLEDLAAIDKVLARTQGVSDIAP